MWLWVIRAFGRQSWKGRPKFQASLGYTSIPSRKEVKQERGRESGKEGKRRKESNLRVLRMWFSVEHYLTYARLIGLIPIVPPSTIKK